MAPHRSEEPWVPHEAVVRDFQDFHRLAYKPTFRHAYSVAGGDRDVANDATQDAFVVMYERWVTRSRQTLGENQAYAIRIAHNRVIDHHRWRSRIAELDEERDACVEDPALGSFLEEVSLLAAVRAFLADQPPRRRTVAMLRFLCEYEYCEIAEILGITESTARTHVDRVRVLLKPFVDRLTEIDRGGEQS